MSLVECISPAACTIRNNLQIIQNKISNFLSTMFHRTAYFPNYPKVNVDFPPGGWAQRMPVVFFTGPKCGSRFFGWSLTFGSILTFSFSSSFSRALLSFSPTYLPVIGLCFPEKK